MPELQVQVDGIRSGGARAAGDYAELGFAVAPRSEPGARISVDVAPTFVPGGGDRRVLGVQLDRFACRPAASVLRPPFQAAVGVAGVGAVVGAVVTALAFPVWAALALSLLVAAAASTVVVTEGGAYTPYAWDLLRITAWTFSVAGLMIAALNRRRAPLTSEAKLAVVLLAASLAVKLFGLLHPSKPVIDSVFNAHRLDAVMAGQYFFTQPVGGTEMPYAIGLYVFAAPWTWLSSDHVAVIWTVTATVDVLAAALLYPMIVGAWGDRRAALFAVVATQLALIPMPTLANANLPNLFGQSVALAAMAAAVSCRLDLRHAGTLAGFTLLVGWALASHVSTLTTLTSGLGALAVLYWWRGDQSRRRAAVATVVGMAVALVAVWGLYYRHFNDIFITAFARMLGRSAGSAEAATAKGYMAPGERLADLVKIGLDSAGWPLLVLAAIGLWIIWRRGVRDRLVSALAAWAAVWLVFSASTVFARVAPEYVRYSSEFLGRINLATVPALAVLAGLGAAAGWREDAPAGRRRFLRWAAIGLLVAAAAIAARAWLAFTFR